MNHLLFKKKRKRKNQHEPSDMWPYRWIAYHWSCDGVSRFGQWKIVCKNHFFLKKTYPLLFPSRNPGKSGVHSFMKWRNVYRHLWNPINSVKMLFFPWGPEDPFIIFPTKVSFLVPAVSQPWRHLDNKFACKDTVRSRYGTE